MTEYITMVCQFLILVMMIGICWFLWQSRKYVRRTTELIEQYRREISWLGARLDMLEQGRQSQKVTSSK